MIGANYGALPIAHAVGGLRDTVRHLNAEQRTGNGFLFETYDSGGLFWAIQQAMAFYHLPAHADEVCSCDLSGRRIAVRVGSIQLEGQATAREFDDHTHERPTANLFENIGDDLPLIVS